MRQKRHSQSINLSNFLSVNVRVKNSGYHPARVFRSRKKPCKNLNVIIFLFTIGLEVVEILKFYSKMKGGRYSIQKNCRMSLLHVF